MKHTIIFLFALCLVSCGTSKTIRDSKKVIKGDWTLSSITYSETGTYHVTLLEDASRSCVEGSTWQVIPNNNPRVYTIDNSSCELGDRYFVFTTQEIDETTGLYDLLLKPTNKKGQSETNQG